MAKTTYDLTNLGLAAGTHSITVRAKADGYADSEPSNAVEYVVEEIENYLTFSSPNSFTLATGYAAKSWNGVLEYSTDASTWNVWDGTTTLSANSGKLYLRGIGNSKLTGHISNYKWILKGSNITCEGNIENLLDYKTVANGKHPAMATNCYAYMFYDCTSLTSVPALPATTLATNCYAHMFKGCTSLTSVPALPATTLATNCYAGMFESCTNVKLSKTKTGEYQTAYRIPVSETGTTATDAMTNMFMNTGGTFKGTPTINTTYYTSNTVV